MPYRELDTTGYREKIEKLEKENDHYRSLLRGDRINRVKRVVGGLARGLVLAVLFCLAAAAIAAAVGFSGYLMHEHAITLRCEAACEKAGQVYLDRGGEMCVCIDSAMEVSALPAWDEEK